MASADDEEELWFQKALRDAREAPSHSKEDILRLLREEAEQKYQEYKQDRFLLGADHPDVKVGVQVTPQDLEQQRAKALAEWGVGGLEDELQGLLHHIQILRKRNEIHLPTQNDGGAENESVGDVSSEEFLRRTLEHHGDDSKREMQGGASRWGSSVTSEIPDLVHFQEFARERVEVLCGVPEPKWSTSFIHSASEELRACSRTEGRNEKAVRRLNQFFSHAAACLRLLEYRLLQRWRRFGMEAQVIERHGPHFAKCFNAISARMEHFASRGKVLGHALLRMNSLSLEYRVKHHKLNKGAPTASESQASDLEAEWARLLAPDDVADYLQWHMPYDKAHEHLRRFRLKIKWFHVSQSADAIRSMFLTLVMNHCAGVETQMASRIFSLSSATAPELSRNPLLSLGMLDRGLRFTYPPHMCTDQSIDVLLRELCDFFDGEDWMQGILSGSAQASGVIGTTTGASDDDEPDVPTSASAEDETAQVDGASLLWAVARRMWRFFPLLFFLQSDVRQMKLYPSPSVQETAFSTRQKPNWTAEDAARGTNPPNADSDEEDTPVMRRFKWKDADHISEVHWERSRRCPVVYLRKSPWACSVEVLKDFSTPAAKPTASSTQQWNEQAGSELRPKLCTEVVQQSAFLVRLRCVDPWLQKINDICDLDDPTAMEAAVAEHAQHFDLYAEAVNKPFKMELAVPALSDKRTERRLSGAGDETKESGGKFVEKWKTRLLVQLRILRIRHVKQRLLGYLSYFRSVERTLHFDCINTKKYRDSPVYEAFRKQSSSEVGGGPHQRRQDFTSWSDYTGLQLEDESARIFVYEAGVHDCERLETELLRLGSHFINCYIEDMGVEVDAERSILDGIKKVDRWQILLDLFVWEEQYQRSKLEWVRILLEAYEHCVVPERSHSLAQEIMNALFMRPVFDLEVRASGSKSTGLPRQKMSRPFAPMEFPVKYFKAHYMAQVGLLKRKTKFFALVFEDQMTREFHQCAELNGDWRSLLGVPPLSSGLRVNLTLDIESSRVAQVGATQVCSSLSAALLMQEDVVSCMQRMQNILNMPLMYADVEAGQKIVTPELSVFEQCALEDAIYRLSTSEWLLHNGEVCGLPKTVDPISVALDTNLAFTQPQTFIRAPELVQKQRRVRETFEDVQGIESVRSDDETVLQGLFMNLLDVYSTRSEILDAVYEGDILSQAYTSQAVLCGMVGASMYLTSSERSVDKRFSLSLRECEPLLGSASTSEFKDATKLVDNRRGLLSKFRLALQLQKGHVQVLAVVTSYHALLMWNGLSRTEFALESHVAQPASLDKEHLTSDNPFFTLFKRDQQDRALLIDRQKGRSRRGMLLEESFVSVRKVKDRAMEYVLDGISPQPPRTTHSSRNGDRSRFSRFALQCLNELLREVYSVQCLHLADEWQHLLRKFPNLPVRASSAVGSSVWKRMSYVLHHNKRPEKSGAAPQATGKALCDHVFSVIQPKHVRGLMSLDPEAVNMSRLHLSLEARGILLELAWLYECAARLVSMGHSVMLDSPDPPSTAAYSAEAISSVHVGDSIHSAFEVSKKAHERQLGTRVSGSLQRLRRKLAGASSDKEALDLLRGESSKMWHLLHFFQRYHGENCLSRGDSKGFALSLHILKRYAREEQPLSIERGVSWRCCLDDSAGRRLGCSPTRLFAHDLGETYRNLSYLSSGLTSAKNASSASHTLRSGVAADMEHVLALGDSLSDRDGTERLVGAIKAAQMFDACFGNWGDSRELMELHDDLRAFRSALRLAHKALRSHQGSEEELMEKQITAKALGDLVENTVKSLHQLLGTGVKENDESTVSVQMPMNHKLASRLANPYLVVGKALRWAGRGAAKKRVLDGRITPALAALPPHQLRVALATGIPCSGMFQPRTDTLGLTSRRSYLMALPAVETRIVNRVNFLKRQKWRRDQAAGRLVSEEMDLTLVDTKGDKGVKSMLASFLSVHEEVQEILLQVLEDQLCRFYLLEGIQYARNAYVLEVQGQRREQNSASMDRVHSALLQFISETQNEKVRLSSLEGSISSTRRILVVPRFHFTSVLNKFALRLKLFSVAQHPHVSLLETVNRDLDHLSEHYRSLIGAARELSDDQLRCESSYVHEALVDESYTLSLEVKGLAQRLSRFGEVDSALETKLNNFVMDRYSQAQNKAAVMLIKAEAMAKDFQQQLQKSIQEHLMSLRASALHDMIALGKAPAHLKRKALSDITEETKLETEMRQKAKVKDVLSRMQTLHRIRHTIYMREFERQYKEAEERKREYEHLVQREKHMKETEKQLLQQVMKCRQRLVTLGLEADGLNEELKHLQSENKALAKFKDRKMQTMVTLEKKALKFELLNNMDVEQLQFQVHKKSKDLQRTRLHQVNSSARREIERKAVRKKRDKLLDLIDKEDHIIGKLRASLRTEDTRSDMGGTAARGRSTEAMLKQRYLQVKQREQELLRKQHSLKLQMAQNAAY